MTELETHLLNALEQLQQSLERERQPEIQERTLDGPSLGW
ncbi:MbeD/MobD family mobilization/exclusion protein [Escherichia coli]|nr:MbeD/MobD family mobilization/exclusion protein [Escherichia coli]